MLIKARISAGDPEPGAGLLEAAEPLIYQSSLDFRAVEAVSETRQRISEKLAARRGTHFAVQIITETGLRVYKDLTSMKKDQVDLPNAVVWIPDSKTPNGTAEVPLTPLAVEAFRRQMAITGDSLFLFPSDRNRRGHQTTFKTVWSKTLRRAKVPYFRIYDLRSTYATRLSAGGVADEWVTQMLRQGDAQVFKKYSQMKLQMKREALEKLNRRASEMAPTTAERMRTVMLQ